MMNPASDNHDAYGIDLTLIRGRLKLSAEERLAEHQQFMDFVEILRDAKRVKTERDEVSGNTRAVQPSTG